MNKKGKLMAQWMIIQEPIVDCNVYLNGQIEGGCESANNYINIAMKKWNENARNDFIKIDDVCNGVTVTGLIIFTFVSKSLLEVEPNDKIQINIVKAKIQVEE